MAATIAAEGPASGISSPACNFVSNAQVYISPTAKNAQPPRRPITASIS
jgi:hypothetical protein